MCRYWGIAILAMSSIGHGSTWHALELVDTDASEGTGLAAFVSLQNASPQPVSVTLSNGEVFMLGGASGRFMPCASVQGLKAFIRPVNQEAEFSVSLECGHGYALTQESDQ